MFGRRAVYADGWKAVSEHEKGDDYDKDIWRLYNTKNDFSECHDVALKHPDKLKKMKDEANFQLWRSTLIHVL